MRYVFPVRILIAKKTLSTSIFLILIISLLIFPIELVSGNSEVTIFSEDFEEVFPTDNGWEVGDLDAVFGEDYWGTSDYKAHSGSKSGWCAQVGTTAGAATTIFSEGFEGAFENGINGWSIGDSNPNGIPAYWDDVYSSFGGEGAYSGNWKAYCAGLGYGGDASAPTYQTYMDSYMTRTVDLTSYYAASVSFSHKMPSLEPGGYDYGQLLIDGTELERYGTTTTVWTYSNIDLTDYIGTVVNLKWNFHSDITEVAEGWYIDDINVWGILPESNAYWHLYDYMMSAYMKKQIDLTDYTSTTLSYWYWTWAGVLFGDNDNLQVQISLDNSNWITVRTHTGNSGGWIQDTVDLNQYAGSIIYIRFLFSSDGSITSEGAYLDDIVITGIPEDNIPPTLSINSPSNGTTSTSSSVDVAWTCSDDGSGIDHCEIKLDQGSWVDKGASTAHTFTDLGEGSHTVYVKAWDNAGNSKEEPVNFSVNLITPPSPSSTGLPLEMLLAIAGGIAVIASAAVVLIIKRRKPKPIIIAPQETKPA